MREATNQVCGRWPAAAMFLAGLLLVLAGCAGTMREPPPSVNYVPDASYHLLMAEIALQRGVYRTAAQEYLTAAEQSQDVAVARRATEFTFDYGLDQFALLAARRWESLEPDSTLAHEYLGRLYLRRYDQEQAYRYFADIIGPASVRSGDEYLALAADLEDEPNANGVLKLLLRFGAEGPDSPGYQLAIARAALRAGATELAVHAARRAAQGGRGRDADVLLGRALFLDGQVDASLTHLARLVHAEPGLSLELEFLRVLASSGELALAERGLDRLLESRGRRPEILLLRGLLNLESDDLDAAAGDFNEVLSSGYDVYEALYYLGEIAAAQGRRERALRYFRRIGAGAYLLPAQFSIAALYAATGDEASALAQLDGFAGAYPRYAFDMLDGRARLLQRLGRDEEALQTYGEALSFKPDSLRLLIARGTLLDRLGRLEPALADLQRAVELAPDDADALNTLGYTLANRTRRHAEAEAYIRLAMQLQPDSPAIMDSLGWVLFRRGREDEALSCLQLAYDWLPDAEVAAHLGEVLWAMGDREAARSVWAEAAEAEPDNKPLLETIERLQR